ncbi:bifunctional ADP-dependent NAD(P)H-hydrate dehydratase/NAD(P)H-hydrate epimerase [Sinomonas sp. B1-1]|uniref:bifunctional ADP-dependent NAD(P)H-hydrate dehydratase/NAD(P)H-hydrate epimerase n=1 Tax=Sinomonas sp. B1-1 TaxID=3141454 RepID=UPI003D2D64DA
MITAYTGAQVRAAERPLLESGEGPALMARAAHGLALAVVSALRTRRGRVYGARVAALVGKGNNGGDALFALAELARRGARTTAVLTSGAAHTEGLAALRAAGGRVAEDLEPADVVIDAVLGTGFTGEFRAPAPRPDAFVIACDVPSGLNADTGAAGDGVWPADATVTFGALKTGLLVGRGKALAGAVEVVDIGLAPHLPAPDVTVLEPADAARLLPHPRPDWHKYSRGVLGLVAGSEAYPGAAVLATAGALATGVGMVRLVAPDAVRHLVLAAHPEVVGTRAPQGRVQAWAAGPGIADDDDQHHALHVALGSGLPAVVDASALEILGRMLAEEQGNRAHWEDARLGEVMVRLAEDRTVAGEHLVLTPHAGELAALLGTFAAGETDLEPPERGEIEAAPLHWAREAAARLGVTVLLKGPATVCAAPDGTAFVQGQGHPFLATAGSGDTLTGILGALLATTGNAHTDTAHTDTAQGSEAPRPVEVAALAALVHGFSGRVAAEDGPYGAGELAPAVRTAMAALARAR